MRKSPREVTRKVGVSYEPRIVRMAPIRKLSAGRL